MIIAGIDPGFEGAIAFLDTVQEHVAAVWDMPITVDQKGKRHFVPRGMAACLELAHPDLIVIEQVGPRPHEGVAGVFRFGEGFGMWQGIVAAMRYDALFLSPQTWKSALGLVSADKEEARAKARELYPFTVGLDRKRDHNRAEAILIAHVGFQLVYHEHRQGLHYIQPDKGAGE